jgi:pimeloyl-ACP methyl ester carboxylesterase
MKPTIVLVHGAFAESASWDGVIDLMAERAGARRALEIPGASHAAPVSHPKETVGLILEAAALPATA